MRDRFNSQESLAGESLGGLRAPGLAGRASVVLGVAAAGAAFWVSAAVAPGMSGVAGGVLACVCLAIAIVDYRRMIIPDELNALALVTGLAAAGWGSAGFAPALAADAVLRAGVMFAAFFGFRWLYRQVRGVEGMGLGDVKLAAVAGAWLNWTDLPIVVDIAALTALAALLGARLAGRRLTRTARVPFGVFFAPAIWIGWALAALWRGGPLA